MSIRCKDILQLPSLKNLKIVGGKKGLDRLLRWVHVIDLPDISNWIYGGELIIMTGIRGDNTSDRLIDIVNNLYSKNATGLIINTGPYIPFVPQPVISHANELDFPLFTLPWQEKIVDITQTICSFLVQRQIADSSKSKLVEDLLFGDISLMKNIKERTEYNDLDIDSANQVCLIEATEFKSINNGNLGEVNKKEIRESFYHKIIDVFEKYKIPILNTLHNNKLIILVKIYLCKDEINYNHLINSLSKVMRNTDMLAAYIGFGSISDSYESLISSYKEAECVVKVAAANKKNISFHYRDLGIYRLLFYINNTDELKSFYNEVLNQLIEYDSINGTLFLESLRTYIDNNMHMPESAKALHIHLNTLKYRIKRIEEILGISMRNTEDFTLLKICFAIEKLYFS